MHSVDGFDPPTPSRPGSSTSGRRWSRAPRRRPVSASISTRRELARRSRSCWPCPRPDSSAGGSSRRHRHVREASRWPGCEPSTSITSRPSARFLPAIYLAFNLERKTPSLDFGRCRTGDHPRERSLRGERQRLGMSSVTTWTRLEPLPRSARLHLGTPGRDRGSALAARSATAVRRAPRRRRGIAGAGAAHSSERPDLSLPRGGAGSRRRRGRSRPRRLSSSARSARRAGACPGLARRRRVEGRGRPALPAPPPEASSRATRRAAYVTHYAIADSDLVGDDADTSALRRGAVGRAPDGRRLHADLRRAREPP